MTSSSSDQLCLWHSALRYSLSSKANAFISAVELLLLGLLLLISAVKLPLLALFYSVVEFMLLVLLPSVVDLPLLLLSHVYFLVVSCLIASPLSSQSETVMHALCLFTDHNRFLCLRNIWYVLKVTYVEIIYVSCNNFFLTIGCS